MAAGGFRLAARVAARARMRARAAAQQAAGGAGAPGAPSLGPGAFAGPIGAAATAAGATQWASAYAASLGTGQPFSAGANAAAIGATIGGIVGAPFGQTAIGAGIGGGIGQLYQSLYGGQMSQVGYMTTAMARTGMGTAQMAGMAAGFTGMQSSFQVPIGASGAYSAIGQLSPLGMTPAGMMPGGSGMFGQILQGLTGRFGGPMLPNGQPNPGFTAAASALGPMISDPTSLGAEWQRAAAGGYQMGPGGIMGAMAAFGPGQTYAGLGAVGNAGGLQTFQGIYANTTRAARIASIGASGAMAREDYAQGALYGGSREEIMRQWGGAAGAEDVAAGKFGREADLWRDAAMADPSGAAGAVYGGYMEQRAGARARSRRASFMAASAGPDDSWVDQTSQIRTSMTIGGMDPFFPYVPPSAYASIIAQDNTRLAQIASQLAKNPAAIATLGPERSQLMIERAGATNAMQSGIMGQIMDISAGMPTGFQGWGLGGGSAAALGRRVPGAPLGLGGSGEISTGQLTETNRLIERLINAVEGNRGFGGAGATSGSSPFSLAPRAANHFVGP